MRAALELDRTRAQNRALQAELRPGDRVVVTGPLARGVTAQRLTLQSLTRPADGFTWHAPSQ